MMGGSVGGEGETKTLAGLKETIRKDIEQTEKKRIENDLKKIEEIVDMEVEIAKVVDAYYLTKKL